MSARAPVEDVPHHVEVVHRQALDELAELHQEVGGPADVDDGGDDVLVVVPLVVVFVVGVQHLIDDVGVLPGHGLAHLGAGVLGGYLLAALHQPVDGNFLPILRKMSLLYHSAHSSFRILYDSDKNVYGVSADFHGGISKD